jgi:hypothetical protein
MGPGVPHSAKTTDNTIHLNHQTNRDTAAGGDVFSVKIVDARIVL